MIPATTTAKHKKISTGRFAVLSVADDEEPDAKQKPTMLTTMGAPVRNDENTRKKKIFGSDLPLKNRCGQVNSEESTTDPLLVEVMIKNNSNNGETTATFPSTVPDVTTTTRTKSTKSNKNRELPTAHHQQQKQEVIDSKDGMVYYRDKNILIRRFQPSDEAEVKQVFRQGIESNIPWAIRNFTTSPAFGLSAGLAGLAAHGLVQWGISALLGTKTTSNGNNKNTAILTSRLALAAGPVAIASLYYYWRQKIINGYQGFIAMSIKDDLSNIPAVYLEKGKGTFLVAMDTETREIVGCIAGEDKNASTDEKCQTEKNSNELIKDDQWQFEIRRLAVRKTHRRQRLAQRLLRNLEKQLLAATMERSTKDDGSSTGAKASLPTTEATAALQTERGPAQMFPESMLLFLTCSSNQIPAHHFYDKSGYERTASFLPPKAPKWIRWFGFQIHRYERQFSRTANPPREVTAAQENQNQQQQTWRDNSSNDDSYLYYQDDDILIRCFQPGDIEGVQEVFRQGVQSTIPSAIHHVTTSPAFAVSTGLAAWGAHLMVQWAYKLLLSRLSMNSNSNSNSVAISGLTLAAGPVAAISSLYYFWQRTLTLDYHQYIETSIKGDLSNIPAFYLEKGDGTFLVAVDAKTQEIVGCIASEDKNDDGSKTASNRNSENRNQQQENPESDDHRWKFEICRLAVRKSHQRQRLAQRLLRVLEQQLLSVVSMRETKESTGSMLLFLTCSSNQVPAHRFYEKQGYERTSQFLPARAPGWIRWFGFEIYRYEHQLTTRTNK